jgi:hypothetical protein
MKRLFLALCALLIASPAFASVTLTGAGALTPGGGGGGGYTGPGDLVASALSWYGLRAYNATWADGAHVAVALIRASDSHTCSVLLTTAGDLGNTTSCSNSGENGQSLSTWGNATTMKVTTLYDQSGALNVVQATDAARPVLTLNCLNTSKPCMTFSGAQFLVASNSLTNQPVSISAVVRRTGTFTTQGDIISGNNGVFFTTSANQLGGYFGSTASVSATDNVWHAAQWAINGSSSAMNVDGTLTSSMVFGALQLSNGYQLGAQSGTTSPLTGNITEVGVWGSALNSTQMTNLCHNQYTYWATSTSC